MARSPTLSILPRSERTSHVSVMDARCKERGRGIAIATLSSRLGGERSGPPRPESQPRALESAHGTLKVGPGLGGLPRGEENAPLGNLEAGAAQLRSPSLRPAKDILCLIQIPACHETLHRHSYGLPKDQESVRTSSSSRELHRLLDAPKRESDRYPFGAGQATSAIRTAFVHPDSRGGSPPSQEAHLKVRGQTKVCGREPRPASPLPLTTGDLARD